MILRTETDVMSYLFASPSCCHAASALDIRDLIVRMQSDDPVTRKIARKKLLNLVYDNQRKSTNKY